MGEVENTHPPLAHKNTRPQAPKDCRYAWAHVFGAVCPNRGIGAAPVMPHVNTEAMNAHFAEISRTVAPDAHAILILDDTEWHRFKGIAVPPNITLMPLPPYSPELNSVENFWQFFRQNQLANRVFDTFTTPSSTSVVTRGTA